MFATKVPPGLRRRPWTITEIPMAKCPVLTVENTGGCPLHVRGVLSGYALL